jgi:molecular chaperone GrpE
MPQDEPLRVVDRRWWARANADAGEAAEAPPQRKPTAVEDLEQQLADKTAQLQGVLIDHRRALEEFDQVKARMRREVARDVERARRGVLAEFLEVVDNLDRAIAAARETPSSSDTLLRGVELVRDQFLAKLDAFGVRRIDAIGQTFDTAVHEAVSMAPVEDPSQDGLVVGVAKEGYAIGDEVLRPAAVVVGRLDG